MSIFSERKAIRRQRAEAIAVRIYEPFIIGGIRQWLEARGRSAGNPILLYLHGGPGASMKVAGHLFQGAWEDHFTVVHWDQRGVGRTFRDHGTAIRKTMTFARMLEDAEEVIVKLTERFNQRQVIVLGHSWGTALGVALVKRRPELISAYVGVGQVVNMRKNEDVSYAHVLARAKESRHRRARRSLEAIGPVTHAGDWKIVKNRLAKQRYWLHRFGGCITGSTSVWPLLRPIFVDPDQSPLDWIAHIRGLIFSTNTLGAEFLDFDADSLGLDFPVPMYFFAGRNDINTPSELAYEYFSRIMAPRKEFIWFESSAHEPQVAESEKFLRELLRVARLSA